MRPLIPYLCLLAGCTSADVLRIDLTPRPAAVAATVPILLDEPTRPYRSIALIEVSSSWGVSLERLGRRLAAEAAKAGGDAVLITQRRSTSSSNLVPAGDGYAMVDSDDSRLVGKVIVYQ